MWSLERYGWVCLWDLEDAAGSLSDLVQLVLRGVDLFRDILKGADESLFCSFQRAK